MSVVRSPEYNFPQEFFKRCVTHANKDSCSCGFLGMFRQLRCFARTISQHNHGQSKVKLISIVLGPTCSGKTGKVIKSSA